MQISSIFTVEDFKTGKKEEVTISGAGQNVVRHLRSQYPRRTHPRGVKIILEGFDVDGNFKLPDLR